MVTPDKADTVALLSGGLDSLAAFATLASAGRVRLAVTVDYSQKAFRREAEASRKCAVHYDVEHTTVSARWLGKISGGPLIRGNAPASGLYVQTNPVWVPNRNGVFINIGAAFAEAIDCRYVLMGFNATEGVDFPDNTPAFRKASTGALALSTLNHVRVLAPLAGMKKTSIVRRAIRIKAPLEFVYSCYSGGRIMCGKCPSCLNLRRAMTEAGVKFMLGGRMKGVKK